MIIIDAKKTFDKQAIGNSFCMFFMTDNFTTESNMGKL